MRVLLFTTALIATSWADPVLDDYVARALDRNPEITMSRAEADAASAQARSAGRLPDPMVMFGLQSVPPKTLDPAGDMMSGIVVGVTQMFPIRDIGPMARAARLSAEAKDAETSVVRAEVASAVKRTYFEWAFSRELGKVVKASRELMSVLADAASVRYSVGEGNLSDVLAAQTETARMGTMQNEAAQMEAAMQTMLRALVAAEEDEELPAPLPVDSLPSLDTARAFASIDESARLLAAEAESRAAGAMVAAASRRWIPEVSLSLEYMNRPADEMGDRPDLVSASMSVNVPLWNWTGGNADADQARRMRTAARAKEQATRLMLESDVRTAVAAYDRAAADTRLYETEIVPRAEATVEASLASYRTGRTDFMTVVAAATALLDARLKRVRSVTDAHAAVAEVERLLATPGESR